MLKKNKNKLNLLSHTHINLETLVNMLLEWKLFIEKKRIKFRKSLDKHYSHI